MTKIEIDKPLELIDYYAPTCYDCSRVWLGYGKIEINCPNCGKLIRPKSKISDETLV